MTVSMIVSVSQKPYQQYIVSSKLLILSLPIISIFKVVIRVDSLTVNRITRLQEYSVVLSMTATSGLIIFLLVDSSRVTSLLYKKSRLSSYHLPIYHCSKIIVVDTRCRH